MDAVWLMRIKMPIDSLKIVTEGTFYLAGRTDDEAKEHADQLTKAILEHTGSFIEDINVVRIPIKEWEEMVGRLESIDLDEEEEEK